MKVGIVGAATVGMTLAEKFSEAGREVMIANSRGPESMRDRLVNLDRKIVPASVSEACDCDIVFLAVPWLKVESVLTPERDWSGRILVDTTNIYLSYEPDFQIADLEGESGSEIVSRMAPTAHVIKAFNTLPIDRLFAPIDAGHKRVLFLAGDQPSAVAAVENLSSEIGLHPVSIGSLAVAGRMMELNGPLSGLELLSPIENL